MLAKQFRDGMGLMSSRDAIDMNHHDVIEDCPVSTRDLYRETAIRTKSLDDLKGKETRRLPEEVKGGHVALGVRTELVLPFLICVARSLCLLTCICETGHRSSALLCALRERNFVPINLLSDGEDAIALCQAAMRSLDV